MIAFITRLLLLAQAALAAGTAWLLLRYTASVAFALTAGLAFVITVRLLICANNFFFSWRFGSPTPARLHLTALQKFQLFFCEFGASMITSSWLMPFFRLVPYHAPNSAALPVLLVHGYGCNGAYWIPMSRALKRANVSHEAIDMEPLLADIDLYAAVIHDAVDRLCAGAGHRRIVIVAHSMGGLAARAYLRKYGNDRIAKVITLGTPHHGTMLANYGFGANSVQMSLPGRSTGSQPEAWLRQLAQGESEATRTLFVSIYSCHDNIVVPQASSHLPGARNLEFGGVGHVALAFDSRIQTTVIDEVLSAAREAERREPTA